MSDESAEELAKIKNFVVDTYSSRDPDITQIFHPGKRLRHLKAFKINLEFLKARLGTEVDLDALDIGYLPKVFQDVNRSVQDLLLKCLNPDNRYYVCFDELDLTFEPSNLGYKQRLIGLILAARDFVSAARESGRFLKVLIFLRSDIYQKILFFEDKNKITDTYKTELEWDQPGTSATLKSVMNRRFSQVLAMDTADPWSTVFDETAEMRGHQTKYQHLVDRTFRRPRDIIKFCNSILAAYKQRQATSGGDRRFINEDIYKAHTDYSNYLRNEIVDEIHKYHPDHRIYFEILREIGRLQFTHEDFATAFSTWKGRLTQEASEDQILEALYEFSIIGFYRAGGGGFGGSEYLYRYLDPLAEFNRSSERFRVHWGLLESLGLKQFAR